MTMSDNIFEHLNLVDGVFYWTSKGPKRYPGKIAGTRCKKGYVIIKFNKHKYRAHNLSWELYNGDIPNGYVIDHIDRNPSNNLISNLRLADARQNAINKNRKSNPIHPYRGVKLCGHTGRWIAEIANDKRHYFLGRFLTPENAAQAYNFASYELHGEWGVQNVGQ